MSISDIQLHLKLKRYRWLFGTRRQETCHITASFSSKGERILIFTVVKGGKQLTARCYVSRQTWLHFNKLTKMLGEFTDETT